MKLKDNFKAYVIVFFLGILVGIICRLTDFFPYESLWSLSSMATLFGFWIACVTLLTYFSASYIGAFINAFLYMSGMTISFYGLEYILGFYMPMFSNNGIFPRKLFLMYLFLSAVCGIGSMILYSWNRENVISSFLYALPASGMLAEGIACLLILLNRHMLLGQTIFDIWFSVLFGICFYRKSRSRLIYLGSLIVVSTAVFFVFYKPYMLII